MQILGYSTVMPMTPFYTCTHPPLPQRQGRHQTPIHQGLDSHHIWRHACDRIWPPDLPGGVPVPLGCASAVGQVHLAGVPGVRGRAAVAGRVAPSAPIERPAAGGDAAGAGRCVQAAVLGGGQDAMARLCRHGVGKSISGGIFTTGSGGADLYQCCCSGPFYSCQPMVLQADAMHSFFLYDQICGLGALLIWSVALLIGVKGTTVGFGDVAGLVRDSCKWILVAGPAGAAVRILQRREEAALGEENSEGSKKSIQAYMSPMS